VGAPSLVALYNPHSTAGMAEMPAEDRVVAALDALRRRFGSVPDPDETLVTAWARDPRSLGSYSCVPLGATVDDMHLLGEPVSERLSLGPVPPHWSG
jgi:hypothetical protein